MMVVSKLSVPYDINKHYGLDNIVYNFCFKQMFVVYKVIVKIQPYCLYYYCKLLIIFPQVLFM